MTVEKKPELAVHNAEAIVRSPFLNQGTATPPDSRFALRIKGQMPANVESIDKQAARALLHLRAKSTELDKYIFLAFLRSTNVRLFYRLLLDHLSEITPIIYTPVVGKACQEYSHIFPFLAPPGVPDGLFISIDDLPYLRQIISNYKPYPNDPSLTPQITVITDGSRILGLGDLGVNGMGIPIGKLQLYVAGAGIDPRRCLPITLDVGTNNQRNLDDQFYLGLKRRRIPDSEFFPFMDTVLRTLHDLYPNILIQFEDFSSEHAFDLLDKYKNNLFCFNDDIQGTGSVILSGFMNAIRLAGIDGAEHRIVFFGAGSAAVGVGKELLEYFKIDLHIPEEKARKMVWLVDTKGLVTLDRGDHLAHHKEYFARDDNYGQQFTTLLEILDYVKPTVLVGLSSQGGVFDEKVLVKMAQLNRRPVIFPLSNPATAAECSFEQAMVHTKNRVIFASGTAFSPYTEPYTNRVRVPGQGNNMYIFPGLGLGSILAKPPKITESMIYAASSTLAESLTPTEREDELLYPKIGRIREVSAQVAAGVIVEAVRLGLARDETVLNLTRNDEAVLQRKGSKWLGLVKWVKDQMWIPDADYSTSVKVSSGRPHEGFMQGISDHF